MNISGIEFCGQPQNSLIIIGSFEKCESESAPAGFVKGQSYETCDVFLLPPGASLQAVEGTGGFDTPTFEFPITRE